ncbi:shikimate kinase [Bradyrhizobium sp. B097]|uniref:shikimate kinase n=1 Tax=Bradyrhizobium sp. B097 TaxID=3140244 RepID=UPI0031834AB7
MEGVATQSNAISEQQSNAALHAIYFARDIVGFSRAVVEYDRRLAGASDGGHAAFMQKAAARFGSQFVARFEDDIRRGKSWGYATACNAVSREAGGQDGIEACKAMAARVSQLDGASMREIEPKALSLFAVSFGRHPQSKTCRNGTIRIAEFCRDEHGALGALNSQSLSLLANGFSKWPQRAETRQGTEAIAREVRRRAHRRLRLSDFNHQELANLVNGFSKWPEAADCRDAMVAIAGEVLRRTRSDFGLPAFNHLDLANLVNGFGKCPEEDVFCQATATIAGEILRRDRLSDFTHQELANLVNGFSKWPEEAASREAAGAVAGEVLRRDRRVGLSEFSQQELANLVNSFTKWPEEEWSRKATEAIAAEVGRRTADSGFGLSDCNHQDLANLVNGFSKWPQEAVYRQATVQIAIELSRRAREQGLSHFTPQDLANLVNGLSKCPDDANYHQATVAIASEVIRRRAQFSDFTDQNLTNLVNGFSKWPQQVDCRCAAVAIAGEVFHRDDRLSHLARPALATLVNGFSKWPEEAASRQATVAIAGEVLRRAHTNVGLSDFSHQELANLVNGFSKWPEEAASLQVTVAIANEVLRRGARLGDFTHQQLASLVNGFGKWPEEEWSRQATGAIAGEVLRRSARLGDFTHQHLANLVNGFSKWPDEAVCRDAAVAVAAEVVRRDDQLSHPTHQALATLVNGFSKWPGEAASRQATVAIADEVRRRARRGEFGLSDFNHQDLVNLVNGFSKWPEEAGYQQAADAIAHEVLRRGRLGEFTHPHLANLVNGFSKWPDGADCREATVAIAGEIRRRQLSDFAPHELANLVNGFSKRPEAAASQQATVAIAHEVLRREARLCDFTHQHLANLVNGFSKWLETADCRDASVAIAREVLRRQLSDFAPQGLANLMNGFSKWPEEAALRQATVAIANEVLRRGAHLSDFNHRHLANLANGFSKWPDEVDCRVATVVIAGEIRRRELSDFTHQELANLVAGFSKWPEEAALRQAAVAIANEVIRRGAHLCDFNHQQLANLVNGFSKWPESPDTRDATFAIAGEVLRRGARLGDFTHRQLASLVNGFGKWPEEEWSRQATGAIAGEILRRGARLGELTHQQRANLVNGFSKWPDEAVCRDAAVAIAAEVFRRDDQLSHLTQQALATLVNGFSKWPGEAASRQATVAIADEVCRRARRGEFGLSDFNHQDLVNLVNGFSKWPEEADCREATVAIAGDIRRRQLRDFAPHELANLVNGFSKWPEATASQQATVAIAHEVLRREARLCDFTHQHLANLVNGFSKWLETADCRDAGIAIAREVLRRQLSDFAPQGLANLVNGFSKWPESPDSRDATFAIAGEILRRNELSDFAPQGLANLVNGFSKWPEEVAPQQATVAVANEVRRRQLSDFAPQGLANLVNGLSKWPESPDSRDATFAIAGEILRRNELSDFAPQGLANLVNGFSKWPEELVSQQATVAIANEVRRRQLSDFAPQHVATLMNGFTKWSEEPACRQATMDIARGLGARGQRFGAFTTSELSMLANALSRTIMSAEDSGDIADAALSKDRLHKLAHYLHYDDDRLKQADVLHIATIFKGLGKARLADDFGMLARTGLNRLAELRQAPDFTIQNDLETMGNLCAALLPLARSPQRPLRWHRRQTLGLLNDLQPVIEHKIEAHLNASDAERTRGPLASRCPALSIYQTLKARAVLARLFRPPYVEGNKPDLRIRQQELQHGTREILAGVRDLIQGDLSSMSWNLIAQIEADNPVDVLDLFMKQDAAAIQAQHTASVFDVHQVLRAMDHAPRSPQGDAGLMQLPVVDMQGRPVATEPERRYSIFHRLTSGAVPVVAVQLPAPPSAFMLARTMSVNGVPYRMDLFGGSKLKPPRLSVAQVAARAPGELARPSGGKLLAIPYAETAPGTAFEQLSRAWAPFKEAYYYTQRRGFAAPPAIKGLSPHDYALEGAFKLALLPDRAANEEHPFKLRGPDGWIALRPHDGCGFIRASLANLMPAVRRAGEREGPDRLPAYGEGRKSPLPVSALQHYPGSQQVADEAREKAWSWLKSREEQKLSSEELFRTVTAANINGPGAVAVPSADGCLHVGTLKSETLNGGGVLIGRTPYDKPNICPFAPDLVRSAADGDPTAAFLDQCVTMQYSFNVAQKSGEDLAADDPTFFAKGLLIVVPDEIWPADFADRGLVMSTEDVKCHSSWTKGKDRAKADTAVDCVGILQATEMFAPGSVVAVPPAEQKKLDGDFDGDSLVIVADRPQLYEHVRQFYQEEQARGFRSFKPPKSHTPAIEDGRYKFSRASQIVAATQNVLEVYTGLQLGFLAQSHEARQWFAERAIFGMYEGIHHELKRDIRGLLEQEQVNAQDIRDKLENARRELELADHPVAREIAALLLAELEAWAATQHAQVPPETAGNVSEAQLAMSQPLHQLFPELAETYPATAQPRDRVQLLLDRYPTRLDPRPDGYNPHDLVQSANNLLSLGIKVGTDAYKSDTGAHIFMIKSRFLQHLLQQTPGLKSVPYTKTMAATLHQGRFDVDATLEDLKDNPTLAASVMQASIKLAAEQGILPESSVRGLAADDSAATFTLTREQAAQRAQMEASRAQAEEKDITQTAVSVAEALRRADIEVKMPHFARRLRSEMSLTDQLIGMQVPFETSTQLVSNAVRHVFEFSARDFTRAFKKANLVFDESGYAEVRTINSFRTRSPTFVGIKTVFATPGGYRFEAEFHTADSYKAKLDNHDMYKELQKLQRLQRESREPLDQSIAGQLLERVRQACDRVVIPDGAIEIPHWEADADSTLGASLTRRLQVTQPRRTAHSPMATEILGALGVRPIVLVGLPAAGKSTIGPRLAKRLGLPFIDPDKHIEKVTRMSISEIFATKGERWFRDHEAAMIAQSLEKGPVVLATGGGSLMREETRDLIGKNAVSIWLDTDKGQIWRRLAKDKSRPLLQTDNPHKTFNDMVETRTPHYRQADLTVVPSEKTDNSNADVCMQALHAYLCGDRASVRQ